MKGKEGNAIFSTLTSGMSKSGAQGALKAATDFNVIENASDTMDLGWNDSPSATAIQAKVETNDQQGKAPRIPYTRLSANVIACLPRLPVCPRRSKVW